MPAAVQVDERRLRQVLLNLFHPYAQVHDATRRLAGSMTAICDEAQRLAQADARYRPFAERVRRLANDYQVRALGTLVKESLARRE